MKKIASLLSVAVLAGVITLGAYKLFMEAPASIPNNVQNQSNIPVYTPTSYTAAAISGIDFTEAAERTVNGVVHVSNKQEYTQPRNMMEFLRGGGQRGSIVGAGSGVIISGDGFIITNNHVIEGATEIEVALNDNRKYKAKLIGTDKKADIALIKIDVEGDDLPYIAFGDSDAAKVGEWVLAVGNPFNLTSTVTAGIISAKARDIDESDGNNQSFIQTDAAINPGNSGGALVNTYGELIGINTAITSQTGSYVGYAFAVPSNNARKIVEDIMQYGSVQKGILGVRGNSINSLRPMDIEKLDIKTTEGFYVGGVEYESGAEKAGIQSGDIIKRIDNIDINKFSDLSGYISTKRPDDVVQVHLLREDKEITVPVTLIKSVTYDIDRLGIQVKNASPKELSKAKAKSGVVINGALNPAMKRYNLDGLVISEIDDEKVSNIDDVKRIFTNKNPNEAVSIVYVDRNGERNRLIFEN